MRSGLESTSNRNYGAWVQSRNWVQHALARPLLSDAGHGDGLQHRQHASAVGDSHESHRDEHLAVRQRARSAAPLGFTLARWPQDPQGIYFGGNDMLLTPRQMLAFGAAVSRSRAGRRDARSSRSRGSIARSSPRARSFWSGQEYGYGWWMRELGGHRAYFAWGFGGQYIFVVPGLDLVVVTTSSSTVAEDRRSHRRNVFDLVEFLVVEPVAATH